MTKLTQEIKELSRIMNAIYSSPRKTEVLAVLNALREDLDDKIKVMEKKQ